MVVGWVLTYLINPIKNRDLNRVKLVIELREELICKNKALLERNRKIYVLTQHKNPEVERLKRAIHHSVNERKRLADLNKEHLVTIGLLTTTSLAQAQTINNQTQAIRGQA